MEGYTQIYIRRDKLVFVSSWAQESDLLRGPALGLCLVGGGVRIEKCDLKTISLKCLVVKIWSFITKIEGEM